MKRNNLFLENIYIKLAIINFVSIPPDEIAATSKSSTDKKTSSGDKSSSAASSGGALKLKPLSNLVAPSNPKPAEPVPAGLSSFLDKVISALKKTGAGPGPAPKPKSNNLQLPSLNSEEDDTPPMLASERVPGGPHPLYSSSSSRGVSPPRSSEPIFETDNLINDSDVMQILSELDQVRDVSSLCSVFSTRVCYAYTVRVYFLYTCLGFD